MNAGRAGGLATAASEAQIEMAGRVVVELDPALGERLHQIDSAARRVHLASRYNVRWTSLGAEPAMYAVEQQVVVADAATRIRWRDGGRGHQIPPTKHPGLKIPAGSKAALSRRISASAPSLGVSKNSSESRIAAAAAISRRLPRAERATSRHRATVLAATSAKGSSAEIICATPEPACARNSISLPQASRTRAINAGGTAICAASGAEWKSRSRRSS